MGFWAQVAGGGAVASSTRDVGAETAATRSSGDGYARTTGLTSRAREQRERKAGAGARKAAALTGGPARAERAGVGEARARDGPSGPKGRGGGGVGLLSSFLLFWNCFLFSFYFLYLIQIQTSHKFKLDFPRIMHQAKMKSRVQHDATIHTPLGFNLLNYNYK